MNTIPPAVFDLPFEEAIQWFRSKGPNLPTERYDDLTAAEYDYGFAVAGVQNAQQLADFRRAVDRYIAEGRSVQEFRKEFDDIARRYGWSYNGSRNWRSEVIANTNAFSAYGWGRWEQLNNPELMRFRPFRQIIPGGSIEPNLKHAYLTGLVLPADDPIWDSLGPPPWDYGCKHQIVALGKEEAERRGISRGKDIQVERLRERQTGRQIQVVSGVNPLFAKGQNLRENRARVVQTQRNKLPKELQQILGIQRLDPESGLLVRFLRHQVRSITVALLTTAFDVARGNFSSDPETFMAQLVQRGLFNYGVAAGVNLFTNDFGIAEAAAINLLLNGFTLTEASKLAQRQIQIAAANSLKQEVGEAAVNKVRQAVSQEKTTQRTYVMSGQNDMAGTGAMDIAEKLKTAGLQGEIVFLENRTKAKGTLLDQAFKGYSDESYAIAKAILKDLANGVPPNKINLIGYSAGANIMENVAGILHEIGIDIDDLVTWGSPGIPPNLGQSTRLRKYFSDKDIVQLFRVPDPSPFDRFFPGIFHGSADDLMFGRNVWRKNQDVLRSTVADLNQFLKGQSFVDPTGFTPDWHRENILMLGAIDPRFAENLPLVTVPPRVPALLPTPKRVVWNGIDLNTATLDQLVTLPISAKQAALIRRWTRTNGPIQSLDDLQRIPEFLEGISVQGSGRVLVTPDPTPLLQVRTSAGELINLNRASRDQLLAAGLSTRQAASLERWITNNGPIESLNDLAQVPDIGRQTISRLQTVPPVVVSQPRTVAEIRGLLNNVKGINRDRVAQNIWDELQRNGPYGSVQDMRQRLSTVQGVGSRTIETLENQGFFVQFAQGVSQEQRIQPRESRLGIFKRFKKKDDLWYVARKDGPYTPFINDGKVILPDDLVRDALLGQQNEVINEAVSEIRDFLSYKGDRSAMQARAEQWSRSLKYQNIPADLKGQLEIALQSFYFLTNGADLEYLDLIYSHPGIKAAFSNADIAPEFISAAEGILPRSIMVPRERLEQDIALLMTVWHELGHHLEFAYPVLGRSATRWREARSTGKINLADQYEGLNALAWDGNFFSSYVGRIYDDETNDTEVISMGLEMLVNEKTIRDFLLSDPEHLQFILGVLSYVR